MSILIQIWLLLGVNIYCDGYVWQYVLNEHDNDDNEMIILQEFRHFRLIK